MRDGNTIAIPKASDAAHLRENWAAVRLRLSPEDYAQIDAAHAPPQRRKPLAML
jgi:diketogulonate reductase-like aldo/keto reductase